MNLRAFKLALKTPSMRHRIVFVLFALLMYRFLAHVPIPIAEAGELRDFLSQLFQEQDLVAFANLFTGGAISNFSIVLMGLGPYITASIIVQMLTKAIPALSELQKEGEDGRRKINQYTRLLALPLALGQSVVTVFFMRQILEQLGEITLLSNPTVLQWALMIASLTGGSMLLMWLGELISEKGIGNGISLLIFASIISQFPTMGSQIISLLETDSSRILPFALFALGGLAVTYFVVLLNEGQRRITVSYARRVQGSRQYGGVESTLPIRVLTAGVVPIIFAVAFMTVPSFLGQVLSGASTEWLANLAANMTVWFNPGSIVYNVVYFGLIIIFTYFYTGVVFNAKDIAENLQKQGGFIPGIRPGVQTTTYLKKVVNRLTGFGALSLAIVALLPFIGQSITDTQLLTFGGTGLLIVVSVAIETVRQVESQVMSAAYE